MAISAPRLRPSSTSGGGGIGVVELGGSCAKSRSKDSQDADATLFSARGTAPSLSDHTVQGSKKSKTPRGRACPEKLDTISSRRLGHLRLELDRAESRGNSVDTLVIGPFAATPAVDLGVLCHGPNCKTARYNKDGP